MEKIFYQNKLLALHVKTWVPGVTALTEADGALQALAFNYSQGTVVSAHRHTPAERITNQLQECIVVIKGKVRASLYSDAGECVKKLDIGAGELFITFNAGHGFEILEEGTLLYEIKNGPFKPDKVLLS